LVEKCRVKDKEGFIIEALRKGLMNLLMNRDNEVAVTIIAIWDSGYQMCSNKRMLRFWVLVGGVGVTFYLAGCEGLLSAPQPPHTWGPVPKTPKDSILAKGRLKCPRLCFFCEKAIRR
jgi:hypothetical protein